MLDEIADPVAAVEQAAARAVDEAQAVSPATTPSRPGEYGRFAVAASSIGVVVVAVASVMSRW